MEINGNFILSNSGIIDLYNIDTATSSGTEAGAQKKGVIKFANGFKIQWDTVQAVSDTPANFALPDPYTEEHYGCMAFQTYGSLSIGVPGLGVGCSFPDDERTSSTVRSNVRIHSIAGTSPEAYDITFVSWGKDSV